MTSMPVRSCLWALAVAWIVASGLYSFPAFQEEVAEKRYLARIARVQAPVIPVDCSGARGVESRDFIREDKNRHRCWVDLASFRRLYPEIAEYTDEAASARINMQAELPLDKWDGSPLEELLKAGALALSLPVLLAAGVRVSRDAGAGSPSPAGRQARARRKPPERRRRRGSSRWRTPPAAAPRFGASSWASRSLPSWRSPGGASAPSSNGRAARAKASATNSPCARGIAAWRACLPSPYRRGRAFAARSNRTFIRPRYDGRGRAGGLDEFGRSHGDHRLRDAARIGARHRPGVRTRRAPDAAFSRSALLRLNAPLPSSSVFVELRSDGPCGRESRPCGPRRGRAAARLARRDRAFHPDALPQRGGDARGLHREGDGLPAPLRGCRRGDRRRQRLDGCEPRHRAGARGARRRGRGARLRRGAQRRHRGGARPLRHHGRQRQFL